MSELENENTDLRNTIDELRRVNVELNEQIDRFHTVIENEDNISESSDNRMEIQEPDMLNDQINPESNETETIDIHPMIKRFWKTFCFLMVVFDGFSFYFFLKTCKFSDEMMICEISTMKFIIYLIEGSIFSLILSFFLEILLYFFKNVRYFLVIFSLLTVFLITFLFMIDFTFSMRNQKSK